MKITPPTNDNYAVEQLYKQVDSQEQGLLKTERTPAADGKNFNEKVEGAERELPEAAKGILTTNEQATLHMLFGSNQPEEMHFYGNARITQIHKGQLLDVKG